MNVHGPIGVVYGKRKDCLQLPFSTSKKVIFVQMNLDMKMNFPGSSTQPSFGRFYVFILSWLAYVAILYFSRSWTLVKSHRHTFWKNLKWPRFVPVTLEFRNNTSQRVCIFLVLSVLKTSTRVVLTCFSADAVSFGCSTAVWLHSFHANVQCFTVSCLPVVY